MTEDVLTAKLLRNRLELMREGETKDRTIQDLREKIKELERLIESHQRKESHGFPIHACPKAPRESFGLLGEFETCRYCGWKAS